MFFKFKCELHGIIQILNANFKHVHKSKLCVCLFVCVLLFLSGRVTLLEEPMDPENPVLDGTTVSFQCQASSIPGSIITWYRYEQDVPVVLVNGTDPMVTIVEEVVDGTVVSNLSIVLDDGGFTQYYCLANNSMFVNRSRNATVIRGSK